MLTPTNILKIKTRMEYMHKEIMVILESIGDIQTKEFHRHVKFLKIINSTTPAGNIQNEVDTLIDTCMRKPETKIKYQNLLRIINEFLGIDESKKSPGGAKSQK